MEFSNVIDDTTVPARSGERYDVIDPAHGKVYATAPVSGAEDVDLAVRAAARAFETWRDTTPYERSRALLKLAGAVEARADEIVAVECRDTGKPRALMLSEEMHQAVEVLTFFAGASRLLEGKAAGEYLRGHTSIIRREPIGVCAQITPWNYLLLMAIWKIGPALAAGNSVVLKPSDTTPASTVLLAEIAQEFFPPGVVNAVCGDRDTGRALVAHPVPQMVSVTGSVRAGMEVAEAAAAGLKKPHLELGGKAPVIVFEDADIAAAAEGIAAAGYFNAGQDCTAATRVLAHPAVAADLTTALVERARATVVGLPEDEQAYLGPVNNANQLARVRGFLDDLPGPRDGRGRRAGACGPGRRLLLRADRAVGPAPGRPGQPGGDLRPGDHRPGVRRRGRGGALRQRCRVRAVVVGVDEGPRTRDADGARLDFGCVWINTHLPIVAEMPHGGFKHSGYGKDLSAYSLEDYTRIKHVMSNIDE